MSADKFNSIAIPAQVSQTWGLPECTVTVIKQSENHTYLVSAANERYILRLTPQDHRSRDAIQAELQFITFMKTFATGVSVCGPIAVKDDDYIALLKPYDDKDWFAVLFEHARGISALDKWCGLCDDVIIEAYGRGLGELHQAIAAKGGNAEKWAQMEKFIPQCHETHGGATAIEKIMARAEAGHSASKILANIYNAKVGPFLATLTKSDNVYGAVHGDLNVSNFFCEKNADRGTLWVFDFDQVHFNWFGFDVAVILKMVKDFEEDGLGIGKIEGFDADRFRRVFLDAYKAAFPAMIEAGHMEPEMLEKFCLYREFYHTGVASDILWQAEQGKHFEKAITAFCEICVKRLESKYSA